MTTPPNPDQVTAQVEHAVKRMDTESKVLTAASLTGVIVLLCLAGFLVTSTFATNRQLLDQGRNDQHTLQILQNATSPEAKAQEAQNLTGIVNRIIVCIENHTDRAVAASTGRAVPPLALGCPADTIP